MDRLRRIQQMTVELGMNLAGVERVFELEGQIGRMQRKVEALERRAAGLARDIAVLEQVKQSVKGEIVRYEAPGVALVPVRVRAARRPGRS